MSKQGKRREEETLSESERSTPGGTHPQGSTLRPHGDDHEYHDISFKSILLFMGVLTGLTIAVAFALWGMFGILDRRAREADEVPPPTATQPQEPPSPRLQSNPNYDLGVFLRSEDSLLNSYGWVDRAGGYARIPIDRAIDIIAARGLPTRPGAGDFPFEEVPTNQAVFTRSEPFAPSESMPSDTASATAPATAIVPASTTTSDSSAARPAPTNSAAR